ARGLARHLGAPSPSQRRAWRRRDEALAGSWARGADVSPARTERLTSFDGTELAIHRIGGGRPLLLLHGLFSSAEMNWIRFGHAAKLAEAGFEAVMPDLRAHGASGKPHDPAAYPP